MIVSLLQNTYLLIAVAKHLCDKSLASDPTLCNLNVLMDKAQASRCITTPC